VTAGYDEQGKLIRKTYYGNTREEVARKVTAAANQVFDGTLVAPDSPSVTTVEQIVTDFLWTFKKPTVSDVTFEWYLNVTNAHIIPAIGPILSDELTPHKIQTLINYMHDEKRLAARTIKGVRDILNQVFIHAVEMKIVAMNPVSGTKLPKRSRVQVEGKEYAKVIPVNVRAEILQTTQNDLRMRTAITALMFTGMRVGEWLALTWGQVDFQNSIVTIDRAITKSCEYEDRELTERKTVVGSTKTQCSVRKIKVSPAVMDVLREWRKALPEHMRRSAKYDPLSAGSVVFPNDMGKMRTYNGFRTTYRRFMSDNNLGAYSLHSYRHTFATMLLEQGVNPKVVQKLLGHRDIETTLGTYSHVLPEVFDGVASIVGKLHAGMMDGYTKSDSIH
jgi:integrase